MDIPATIAIKINRHAQKAVKEGHPWVYERSVVKSPKDTSPPGSLCVLFDQRTNKPFAFGLWDPGEVIRIKIIHQGTSVTINRAFWHKRIQTAFGKRLPLLENVSGYRAIHGENDGFPGLILDVYNKTGVLKIYSEIWTPYLEGIVDILRDVFTLDRVVFRLSRKLSLHGNLPYNEGQIIGSDLKENKVRFEEYGVSFFADPVSGHKTGFFLDQRPNRYWVQKHSNNKKVLDVFSYVGGFGIHALKGNASTLTSIDISSHAMAAARQNIQLNELDDEKWTPITGDAFDKMAELYQKKLRYDIVIIDAPSFANQSGHVPSALKQYERLARWGAALTAPKGYLILGSCSSRISLEELKSVHENAFYSKTTPEWGRIKVVLHDLDHPVTYPEGLYLKTLIYQRKF